ncbi:MAG: type II toxin-antitoxin system HigB family toxin [Acidobacteriota bacterium]
MVVVTKRHVQEAMARYPDAAVELRAWMSVALAARWKNMTELVHTFKDADAVDGYTVFNIRHNRYRLVTVIHFSRVKDGVETRGHIYIRSFLTHREYDERKNWDKRFRR